MTGNGTKMPKDGFGRRIVKASMEQEINLF